MLIQIMKTNFGQKLKFALPVLFGFLLPMVGILPVTPTQGHAYAVSAEGEAEVVWSESTLAVDWTSVDATSNVIVVVGNEKVSDTIGAGSLALPVDDYTGENISITWQRTARPADLDEIIASNPIRELANSDPELFVVSSTVGISIDGSVGENAFISPANAALPDSTSFKYMTFIRESFVDELAWPGCELDFSVPYSYKGDNRSFNVDSPRFRTRMLVTVDWANAGNVSYSTAVGETRQYRKYDDGTYSFHAEKTASSSSMNVNLISKSSKNTSFRMRQDVMNPFCYPAVAAGIYFDYTVSVARSGSYTVTGAALRVPNHEFYIIDSDQAGWAKIFTRTGSDFGCLGELNAVKNVCKNFTPYSGVR